MARIGGKQSLTTRSGFTEDAVVQHSLKATILLGILGILALSGCRPAMHVRAKTFSPDRTKIAYVLEEEPLPLVSMNTVILVKPTNRSSVAKSDVVFRGGDMNGRHFGPVNIRWLQNDLLWIGYCSGRTSIFRNFWLDAQSDGPEEIEILLKKETPGRWPPSGAPNGQSGPPPCP